MVEYSLENNALKVCLGGLVVGGKYVWCLAIVTIFRDLEEQDEGF